MGWIVWGSELSPFTLKVMRLLRHARVPFRLLPAQGGWLENVRSALRVEKLKRGELPMTWPRLTPDDDLPLVPYLLGPGGENLYDSTAIAHWLDHELPPSRRFLPGDAAAAFVAALIDDYADEFLLYVVHHNRWVLSAADNDAGKRLAREYRSLIGPLQPFFAGWFAGRQTRRLAYLFSTPDTRALLDGAFVNVLDILETLLGERPFVLGERFTLADAALYGQLAMNLADPSADAVMRKRPRLHRWLSVLHGDAEEPIASRERLQVDTALKPLLAEICRVHVPLMRQNSSAVARMKAAGITRFNEAAFDRREAMYEGTIDRQGFRHVAKSFQALVWNDCLSRWQALDAAARMQVAALLPAGDHFRPAA